MMNSGSRIRSLLRWTPFWAVLPWCVVVGVTVLVVVAASYTFEASNVKDRARLQRSADRVVSAFSRRLETYEIALQGVQGYIVASGMFSVPGLYRYAASLRLTKNYPGLQGIGFAPRVRNRDAALVKVFPDGEREEYYPITALYPFTGPNQAAVGFDMYSEPTRREAMERARDTGELAASARVTLVHEIASPQQSGLLMYLPVYRGGQTPATVEERAEQLIGFAYAAFRVDDLLRSALGTEYDLAVSFRIYDGAPAQERLLHRSPGAEWRPDEGNAIAIQQQVERKLRLGGRLWTLVFRPTPAFSEFSDRALLPWILLAGIIMALFLGAAAWATVRSYLRLRASEERFRSLADSAPVMIWMGDGRQNCQWVNRPWLDFTGRTIEEERGNGWMRGIHSDDLDRCMTAREEACEQRVPFQTEFRLRREDGEYRWVLDHGIPLQDEAGREAGYLGSCMDITDFKLIENERLELLARERGARAQAEHASRMKDEFLATLSHELRTPLNAILGWAKLVRKRQSDPKEVAQGLEVIERNAMGQARIIEDLLDMSRIISGKVQLELRPALLSDILRESLQTIRPAADAKGVRLKVELTPETLDVHGDDARLHQIFWNLLSNAVKFTPRGGTVTLTARREGDDIEVRVADTGEGIAPEFLPFIFDRFRQADSSTSRRFGGLGLGLSIVKHLVELHGGRVSAESDGVGHGTTIAVRLPYASRDNEGAPKFAERQRDQSSPGWLKGLRVLVVDDEEDTRRLLGEILADAGTQPVLAGSAKEALSILTAEKVDLLLSDIGMPECDGYQFIAAVRASETAAQVPAIAVTAFARAEDKERVLKAGYAAYLSKPIDVEKLLKTMAAVVWKQAHKERISAAA